MARVLLGDGQSCYFWDDLWGDEILSQKFPELNSFAKKRKLITADGLLSAPLHSLFHLPLSQQAFSQMEQLQNIIDGIDINNVPDSWTYI